MHRRDLSKALLATATGSALLAQRADAQTCVAPCFAETSFESAAGVPAPNTAFVSAPEDIRRLGGVGDGATDNTTAISNAQSVSGSSYFARGSYRIASNLALNAAYAPIFEKLATWKPDANSTISIAGPVTAGNQQIFDLSNANSVVTLTNQVVNAAWFGMVPDGNFATGSGTNNTTAMQQAVNALATAGGGALFIPPGIYLLNTQVTIPSGVSVFGAGKWSTILFCPNGFSDTTGLIAVNGTGGYPTCIHGLAILAQTNGAGGCGLVSTKNGFFLSDIWVNGFTSHVGVVLNQTDNFLSDFVIELCLYGLQCLQVHQTIANGTFYGNQASGCVVDNSGAAENGRVTFTNVRSSADVQSGFLVSGGKRVTFDACSCTNTDATKYTTAGLQVDSSNDVIVTGFAGYLGTTSSAAAGILLSGGSTNILVSASTCTNWQDGLRSGTSGPTVALTVNGGNFSGNVRNGIYIAGGDQIVLNGNNCHSNGGSGIYSDNSSASGNHLINGNMANGNVYGLTASIGVGTAFTNLVGNMFRANTSAGIQKLGTTANINDIGNY
jgi:hypothetical protein